MIELISKSRCVSCGLCVSVCPTEVFDQEKGEVPVIARQENCQTCFMCEVYCPTDAMYVSPNVKPVETKEEELVQSGVLGSYKRSIGWGEDKNYGPASDASYKMFKLMRKLPGH